MTLVQNMRNAFIEGVSGNVLTITATNGLTAAATIIYTPIQNRISWSPIDCENPGIVKQFSELTLFFKNAAFREIDAIFSTNISIGTQTVPIRNIGLRGWGQFPWGGEPWGGQLGGQNVLRTYVPREKQRCHWLGMTLDTNEAFTGFSLQGVSLMFNVMSSRVR